MRTTRFVLLLCLAVAACSQGNQQPRPECTTTGALATVCGFENPEDLAFVPGYNMLIVSNLRIPGMDNGGFLSALALGAEAPTRMWPDGVSADDGKGGHARLSDLGEPGCRAPDPTLFAPHGVYVDARDSIAPLLYVVNHGGRESIEIFSFARRQDQMLLYWTACIELPEDTTGNDVAVAADGDVIVSNYMPPRFKILSNLKTLLGWNTGDIMVWNHDKRWRHVPNTAASTPNGVEVSPDDKWLFYSSTGGRTINRVARDGSQGVHVPVEGMPDNLTWTTRGTLLVASHLSALEFVKCSRSQPCRSPWLSLEVDANSLKSNQLLRSDGATIGAVATALETKHGTYYSAVFGDRIAVSKPIPSAP